LDRLIPEIDEIQKRAFVSLLQRVEKTVLDSKHEQEDFWLAELLLRRARIAETQEDGKRNKYSLWKEAYYHATKANNKKAIVEAGHHLGFQYCEFCLSMQDLSDIHFTMASAISDEDEDPARVNTFGQNLFELWRHITFRRLSTLDLRTKKAMLDGADMLHASRIPSDISGLIMILLLSSLHEFKGNLTRRAVERIKQTGIESKIPKDLREMLRPYM